MNRQEFNVLLTAKATEPTLQEYADIEFVYSYHPAIKEVGGKQQIAKLWELGGVRLIKDMMPTAEKAKILEISEAE